MSQFFDRLLLFLSSLAVGILSIVLLVVSAGGVSSDMVHQFLNDMLHTGSPNNLSFMIGSIVLLLISLRLFVVSFHRKGTGSSSSIDQRNDYGDIRISMETVESLVLKTAAKQRGVKDLKVRITTVETGLDIVVRAVVDGETSIPQLTEDIQRSVKEYVEDIAGIPVASVSVFVANIIQAPAFKSRVE